MTLLKDIAEELIQGHVERTAELTQRALDEGTPPREVLESGLIAGMSVVGVRFRDGEMFIPEVLLSASAMKKAMETLRPLLGEEGGVEIGKVVIGTVKGDLHDIGKNLVAMMLEGAGFEVKNLGVDVDADRFVEAVKTEGADIVAMSALLTTTMYGMKETIEALREAGLRDRVKIMVGGASVTEDFARDIGADACAYNAASAIDKAKELLS